MTHASKLTEQFEVQKIEYFKVGTWLYHKIKQVLTCASKIKFSEIIIFLAEVTKSNTKSNNKIYTKLYYSQETSSFVYENF